MTELFDMDLEANLPALFNVLLFLAGALAFHLVGRTEATSKARRPWNLMALVFVFLAFDEGSQIHEKLMLTTLRLMNAGGLGDGQMGWLYYAWIIPYGIAALTLLAILLPWILRLVPRLRWGLLLSGGLFVFGAVFLEAWSGKVAEALEATARADAELPWLPCFVYTPGSCFLYDDRAYVLLYTLEELAEMGGLILCLGVLLRELERRKAQVLLRFGAQDAQ